MKILFDFLPILSLFLPVYQNENRDIISRNEGVLIPATLFKLVLTLVLKTKP